MVGASSPLHLRGRTGQSFRAGREQDDGVAVGAEPYGRIPGLEPVTTTMRGIR
jgi:hypothetical protein